MGECIELNYEELSWKLTQCAQVPICIDLDWTLIRCDLSVWSFQKLWTGSWLMGLKALGNLLLGRSRVKYWVSNQISIDPKKLPYRSSLVFLLRELFKKGWKLYLVTGSSQIYADQIAQELGFFQEALGSVPGVNLAGRVKASFLVKRFGLKQFIYVGDSRKDQYIWEKSSQIIAINPSLRVQKWLNQQKEAWIVTGVSDDRNEVDTGALV
jgi:phosphoserine phosphatase